jgi:hypothetical protein
VGSFFVQDEPKGMWHAESDEHCEVMLCGKIILVDSHARIQSNWGPRRCPDCWMRLEELRRIQALGKQRRVTRTSSGGGR